MGLKTKLFSRFICAGSLIALAACGGSSNKGRDAGALHIEATSEPSPPRVGSNILLLTVSGPDGMVEGAAVTVVPQMPAHGHGSTEVPVVEEVGGGHYRASMVHFQMPGIWEVTVTAEVGDLYGARVFTYEVQ